MVHRHYIEAAAVAHNGWPAVLRGIGPIFDVHQLSRYDVWFGERADKGDELSLAAEKVAGGEQFDNDLRMGKRELRKDWRENVQAEPFGARNTQHAFQFEDVASKLPLERNRFLLDAQAGSQAIFPGRSTNRLQPAGDGKRRGDCRAASGKSHDWATDGEGLAQVGVEPFGVDMVRCRAQRIQHLREEAAGCRCRGDVEDLGIGEPVLF